MKVSKIKKMFRCCKKAFERKWNSLSKQQKRVCFVTTELLLVGLIIGGVIGNGIGSGRQQKMAKKELIKLEKALQKKEDKLKKAEKQLADAHKTYEEMLSKQDQKEYPWNLVLVNASHPMQTGYVPKLAEVQGGYYVDERIAEPLQRMLKDAEADGMRIIICSAYRSIEKQEQVFNTSVKERLDKGMNYWQAYKDTSLSVALPGTSEHGIGLALDLISNQYTELDEKQAETAEAKWLEANCYKYGFILRYPPSKTVETGIIYEPWHYRYVGEADAKKIMESDMTLEEYLDEMY